MILVTCVCVCVCVCVLCVCVCVCVFIKLHITTQSGPVCVCVRVRVWCCARHTEIQRIYNKSNIVDGVFRRGRHAEKRVFFVSIRRVILPNVEKGYFATAFWESMSTSPMTRSTHQIIF